MNWKERIINTIQGKPVDFLPFVPRLDIWYQSNKLNKRCEERIMSKKCYKPEKIINMLVNEKPCLIFTPEFYEKLGFKVKDSRFY